MIGVSITSQQLADARQLVATIQRRSADLAALSAKKRNADARDRTSRTIARDHDDLVKHPERLAGHAEWVQRQHPTNRAWPTRSYRILLKEMIDPFPTFKLHPDDPPPPPATRRRVDFAALPPAARPYLLGPYLNVIQNNRWAEVDLTLSRPLSGHVVMLQTGGPVDLALWKSHLPAISAWLGGTWLVTAHTATTVTLSRKAPLPPLIPFHRSMLQKGCLFVGIDVTQRSPVYIPFADLAAGTYIPGTSGSGKTSALHILLRSIFANLDLFHACYLIDGKDGVALNRYSRLHPKIHVLYEEPDVWDLTANLASLIRERNAAQRAMGVDKATRDFIAVIIDELPTFVAKPAADDKKAHGSFLDNLQRLAMRGRSAGIRLFLISQQPVAEQIPVTLRTNCSTVISFRLPETNHATSLFGELTPENDPRKLPTGQAIIHQADSGKLTTVQFPFAELYQPPLWPRG